MPERTAVLGVIALAVLTLTACGGAGGATTTAAKASDDIAVGATDQENADALGRHGRVRRRHAHGLEHVAPRVGACCYPVEH